MACFFIDFENLSGTALECMPFVKLKKKDAIIIFYSKNASKMTFDIHKELEKIKSEKTYIMTETGTPNALDFQLSSYLGFCIRQNPEQEYYIISKDRGFDCLCHFWQNRNINVKRIDSFYNYIR